jgi:4-amino-4-deoxy-L-arabinose transferase-like glycosyltransferase
MKNQPPIIQVIHRLVDKISDRRLGLLLLALAAPAFLWNLATVAFIGDEGIRSLVALEMKLSGNYIMPTLNGAAYYNKPPLYNWILLASSWLWGGFGEWPARLTTLLFLGLFAWSVFRFHRRHFNELTAWSAAFIP